MYKFLYLGDKFKWEKNTFMCYFLSVIGWDKVVGVTCSFIFKDSETVFLMLVFTSLLDM